MRAVVVALALLLSPSFGCSSRVEGLDRVAPGATDLGAPPPDYFAPSSLSVTGEVLELDTQQPPMNPVTLTTVALLPPPDVSISGSTFRLDKVTPDSLFFLTTDSPPDHLLTYNAPVAVANLPLTGVHAFVVASAYVARLRGAFGVAAQSGSATVFVRVVDGAGAASAGVPAAALAVDAPGTKGPFFLDATLQPAAMAAATSSSGWMVYFDVPVGTLKIGAGPGYTVQCADTPTVANAVSLAVATVSKGAAPPPPGTVSFQQMVVPIFMSRGCYNCHSGNGDGRRLGDLVLDGAAMKIWTALTQTPSPNFATTRVNLTAPANSLLLTMPSYENPPDAHPVVVFPSSSDPDYQTILRWIEAGAKFN